MSQKSLFETSNHDGERSFKIARDSDKETSHKAASKLNLVGNRKLFLETLQKMGGIPRTANEIAAQAIPLSEKTGVIGVLKKRETLRKRAGELVKMGLVRECTPRECRINCNEATTYEVVK